MCWSSTFSAVPASVAWRSRLNKGRHSPRWLHGACCGGRRSRRSSKWGWPGRRSSGTLCPWVEHLPSGARQQQQPQQQGAQAQYAPAVGMPVYGQRP